MKQKKATPNRMKRLVFPALAAEAIVGALIQDMPDMWPKYIAATVLVVIVALTLVAVLIAGMTSTTTKK